MQMRNSLRLGLAIVFSFFGSICLADTVLVVHQSYSTVHTSVKTALEAEGHTVTLSTSEETNVATLNTYDQVWDVRYQALSNSAVTAYDSFVQSGGFLYLTTENPGCCQTRNNQVASLISNMGGGAGLTIGGAAGSASNTGASVNTTYMTALPSGSTITFAAISAISNYGNGQALIYDSSNKVQAVVWVGNAGNLSSGYTGTVITIPDINWLDASRYTPTNVNGIALNDIITGIVAGTVAGTISASGNSGGSSGSSDSTAPTAKQDVLSTIQSVATTTSEAPKMAMSQVNTRLSWLGRRISIGSPELSYQGIDIKFSDSRIQRLLFGDYSKRSLPSLEQAAVQAANYVQQPDRMKTDARALTEDEVLNQLSAIRDDTVGSAKPTYASESKLAGWSWWTMGTVTIGDQDASSDSPGMDITSEYITLGLDGPTESFGIIGASITLGQNETTIGSDGSEVAHKSYVFTLYNSIPLTETFSLRSTLGGTYFSFDTIRIDGAQRLTGDRYGKQGFMSVEIREDGYTFDLGKPVDFEWYVKTDMAHTKLQDYSERGGSLALYFDDHETNTGHLRLGIDAESRFETQHGPLVPYAGLEYATNYSPTSTADMRYVSESTVYTQEMERAYDSEWTVSLGLDYYIKELRYGFSYQRSEQINSGYSDSITFGVEGKF
jgi:hypothetical protein